MTPSSPSAPAPLPSSAIFDCEVPPDDAAVILIPVPFDATASYGRGAAAGPEAIRAASVQVDLLDLDTGHPDHAGIAMLPSTEEVRQWNRRARTLVDAIRAGAADAEAQQREVNALGDRLNGVVRHEVDRWLDAGRIVGLVGGDHATPFASIAAHVARDPDLGILHIDAHADLRHAYEGFIHSHASIMRNVLDRTPVRSLVQVAVRDLCDEEYDVIQRDNRVTTFFDRDLASARFDGEPFAVTARRIVDALPEHVYVSLDIDGLDPALCPHTGTPVAGGLRFNELSALLRILTGSGRHVVGFDLDEVAPGPAGDEWDANVGARVLYKLCGHALGAQPRPS